MVKWRIVATVVLALFVWGAISLVTMPRQEFPDFTIRQGLVLGVMPGATSIEVEQRLAKPVEEYLFSFEEVDKSKTYSISGDGQLVVFVELSERVKGPDAPAFWAKLRHGLVELKAQKLPTQVVALIGNNDFGNTSALLLTVTGDGHSPRELERYLDVVEAHLRRIEATSRIQRTGLQREAIRVTMSWERLAHFGVRPATVWLTLQGLGGLPAQPRLDTDTLELPVHVGSLLRSEDELGETVLFSEPTGPHVRLKDVAAISREYGPDDALVRCDGRTAVVLSVEMRHGQNITRFGRDVDRALDQARRELPPDVRIVRVADQPEVVSHSVGRFLRDFGLAIVAVIAVTMLLLPVRVAAIGAVTIPICTFITLGILNALGVQLQTVSLAGLVVVLGMVVDNAIVVIDDHIERLSAGADPWTAAWQSASSLVVPVTTATAAIVISFVPFNWFLTGIAGDFVGSLPVTMAVALTTSLLVALFLVPALNARFIREGLRGQRRSGKATLLDRFEAVYDRSLDLAFRRPGLVLVTGVLFVLASTAFVLLPRQLFPKVDRNQLAVEIYLPAGSPLHRTQEVALRLEKELLADRRVVHVTTFIGTSSPRFHTVYAPNMPSRAYAQMLVNTVSENATVELLRDHEARYSNAIPEGWVRWKQLDLQATLAPIEVRLWGDDTRLLRDTASRIEAAARTIPGATWVRNDFGDPQQVIAVEPDADSARRLGVSPALLQASLAVGSGHGLQVATLWEGRDAIPVILGTDPRLPASMERFRQQYVSSPVLGASVPLEQLARVGPAWTESAIVHRNGVPTLTVRVDVAMGVLASDVQRPLESAVRAKGPIPGVNLEWGGEKEKTTENYRTLAISMAFSVAFIYLILLFQFQRHGRVLLVMLTMPLSLFGAGLGLVVTGYPFGFTAFIGIISLLGIVVRNGVILVGFADELRRDGTVIAREAALAAGKRRMRPVFLTSAATAVGVVPLILSGSTLWGPLGTVIFSGLLFSMALTLVVLPVAYWRTASRMPAGAAGPGRAAASLVVLLLGLLAVSGAEAQTTTLTLEDCRVLAAEGSTSVKLARESTSEAVHQREAVRTNYLPQVSASAGGYTAHVPLLELQIPGGNLPVFDASGAPIGDVAFFPGGSIALGQRGFVGAITAVQPVYAGDRITNGSRLARLGVSMAEDQERLARRDAVAEAEEKYWRLVALEEKGKTLRAYRELLATLECQAGDAVTSGLTTPNDLLKVTLKLHETEVDALRLDRGIELASRDLARHIGLPDGSNAAVADTAPPPPVDPSSLADLRQGALDERVEMKLLEKVVHAEELQTALKIGEARPSLAIGAQVLRYDLRGAGARNNALAFATMSVPITGALKGVAEARSQQARARAAELRLGETRRLLALEIEKRWDDLEAAWRAALVSEQGVEQAEVNLAEVSDQFTSGMVQLSDLLEAQVLRHQAVDRRTDAAVEFWLAQAAYLRAVGRDGHSTRLSSGS